METIDKVITELSKIQGWPAVALVFASCIVVGYIWKGMKLSWFPNEAIPMAVIAWGAFAMTMSADVRATGYSLRLWLFRNVLIGLTIGFTAWMSHYFIISKIEDWLSAKFGGIKPPEKTNENQTDTHPPAAPPGS
jgi:hypothetical protein